MNRLSLSILLLGLLVTVQGNQTGYAFQAHGADAKPNRDAAVRSATPVIHLRIDGQGYQDNLYFQFTADGVQGIDPYDAFELGSLSGTFISFYSLIAGDFKLAINNLPDTIAITEHKSTIAISSTLSGSFTITAVSLQNIPSGWKPTLHDLETGTSTLLTTGSTIPVTIQSYNTQPYERFRLTLDGGAVTSNSAPTSEHFSLTGRQDSILTIPGSAIAFIDSDDGDRLFALNPLSLPSSGTLFLDSNSNGTVDSGEALAAGDTILHVQADRNLLKFKPATGTWGFEANSLTFSVSDGFDSSATYTLNLSTEASELTITGTSGQNAWHFLANPYFEPLAGFLSDTWTQGAINSDAPSGSPNLFTYDETIPGFQALTGDLNAITAGGGKGFVAYLFADDDGSTTTVDGDWPKVLSMGGDSTLSEHTVALTNTDHNTNSSTDNEEGWNLVGNPFGTALSADSLLNKLEDLDPNANANAYIWNQGSGSYELVSQGSSGSIAPFQSFFVRLGSSGSSVNLLLDENDRITGQPALLKRQEKKRSGITLFARDPEHRTATTNISFNDKARAGLDRWDGYWLNPLPGAPYLGLYTLTQEVPTAHSVLPLDLQESHRLPLIIEPPISESVVLSWKPHNLPFEYRYELYDRRTGRYHSLMEPQDLTLEITASHARKMDSDLSLAQSDSAKSHRFEIVITHANPLSNSDVGYELPTRVRLHPNYPNPFNPSTTIRFELPDRQHIQLAVYDLTGRMVAQLINQPMSAGQHSVIFEASNLSSGIYIFRLEARTYTRSRKMVLVK